MNPIRRDRSLIIEQPPFFLVFQPNCLIRITLNYGRSSGRGHSLQQIRRVSFINNDVPTINKGFQNDVAVQYVSASVAKIAANENSFILPTYYDNNVIVLRVSDFAKELNNWGLGELQSLLHTSFRLRRITLEILDPPAGASNADLVAGKFPIEAYRKQNPFAYICPNGLNGLLEELPRLGALSFLLYPTFPLSDIREGSAALKPVRFLISGTGADPNVESSAINNLCQRLSEAASISVGTISVQFVPCINIANTIRAVSVVQCSGYTRVAGQSEKNPVAIDTDELQLTNGGGSNGR